MLVGKLIVSKGPKVVTPSTTKIQIFVLKVGRYIDRKSHTNFKFQIGLKCKKVNYVELNSYVGSH